MSHKATVLLVCPPNAKRSQIAAGYLHHGADGRVEVRSAGPNQADKLNLVAVQLMAEDGIHISGVQPQSLMSTSSRRPM